MDTLILNKDGSPLSVLPISIVDWQSAIRLLVTEKVFVLKEHENWTVRSPSTEINVPSIVMTTDYIKYAHRVKYNRSNVLLRDDYTCQYCGDKPGSSALTLDHVLPRRDGGKTNWKNITTACGRCNSYKGHNAKIRPAKLPYEPSYYELVAKRRKYPLKVRDLAWAEYLSWDDELVIPNLR